ncbi:hypothetical protein [Actinomadura geliboluensis]|uniref:hypothetical protein n=1 Tax=Actinomadura geliboluensis TaxID=882440 RepID=UPI0026B02D7A
MATQDTVAQLIAAVRAAICEVPGAAEVATARCTAHDYTDPGKPRIALNDEQARADLVDALVTDALRLLGHLPGQELGERAANTVGILAQVAGRTSNRPTVPTAATDAVASPTAPPRTG